MALWNMQAESRYLDHAHMQSASIVLFDLLATFNAENGAIANLVMADADPQAITELKRPRILDRLNTILADAGLAIQLTLTPSQTFDAVNIARAAQYPIFQMSDGEKSAVLLASEILTAEDGSIQIIDEPERHLHRAISAGLIEAIVAARPDCHFVILTHDLGLASSLDKRGEQTFVLSQPSWAGKSAVGWELYPVDAPSDVPENARAAILGGRRNVLFIEGQSESLDVKLYKLLFPGWGLSPTGGGDQVTRAVSGLQSSEQLHWIHARGIVDGDGRSDAEREALLSRGVLPLPVSEVESLYYMDVVVEAVAASQAAALDKSAGELSSSARQSSLEVLRTPGTFDRLAGKLALAEVRRKIVESLPTELGPGPDAIDVSITSPYGPTLEKIQALSDADDLDGLVRLLPIRDTALRGRVASVLGFRGIADYEAAARVRVKSDDSLARALRSIAGAIPA